MKQLIVRSKEGAVCVCRYERLDDGSLRLISVSAEQAKYLEGDVFPDKVAMERAVFGAAFLEHNVLDRVLLSPDAMNAWQQIAVKVLRSMGPVDPSVLVDEQADGSLLIWAELPGGQRLELVVPKGHWRFR